MDEELKGHVEKLVGEFGIHKDYNWLRRSILALVVAERDAGRSDMLRWIKASLEQYPNGGGDITVMQEVDRLLIAERDAKKQDAIQHRPTQCLEASGYLTRCECGWKSAAHRINWQEGEPDEIEQGIEEWKAHVRSLTPSTAQSREREIAAIRLREARWWYALAIEDSGVSEDPGLSENKRIAELESASSQPKGEEK